MQEIVEGYHGTAYENANIILNSSFKPSIGDEEWVGDGVYYFVKGRGKPVEHAENWVKLRCFDSKSGKFSCNIISILGSNIEYRNDKLLDLRRDKDMEIIRFIISKFGKKISPTGKKVVLREGHIINFAHKEKLLDADLIIGDFYIRFLEDIKNNVRLRTNNVTICCVRTLNIIKSTIEKKKKII